jgi:hypothetical protein
VKYLKEKGIWNTDYENRNRTNTAQFEAYCQAYQQAKVEAAASGIEVKSSNEEWTDFWVDHKQANALPQIRMHASLTEDCW